MSKPVKKTEKKDKKEGKKRKAPECPCGGGQSCIVSRRYAHDWVVEDDVLREANVPLREHCFSKPTKQQNNAMKKHHEMMEKGGYDSIVKRFKEDIG